MIALPCAVVAEPSGVNDRPAFDHRDCNAGNT